MRIHPSGLCAILALAILPAQSFAESKVSKKNAPAQKAQPAPRSQSATPAQSGLVVMKDPETGRVGSIGVRPAIAAAAGDNITRETRLANGGVRAIAPPDMMSPLTVTKDASGNLNFEHGATSQAKSEASDAK
jgi:hypothetical protein